jgi:outer membrane protein OmpA-like peptidoglycan-associated protein
VKVVASTTSGDPVDAQVRFNGPTIPDPLSLGQDGVEEIDLPHGRYTVLISADSFGTTMRTIELNPATYDLVLIELILQPGKVRVTQEGLELTEKVHFDLNEAEVGAASMGLLSEVAYTLMAHDHIERIEVQGHTDDQGEPDYNLDLSQRRVEAVRSLLVDSGVAPDRLVARGYGETQPIASNDTEEGQAKNRRVQFVILDSSEHSP